MILNIIIPLLRYLTTYYIAIWIYQKSNQYHLFLSAGLKFDKTLSSALNMKALTRFMPLFSYGNIPEKTRGTPIISEGIERDQWPKQLSGDVLW